MRNGSIITIVVGLLALSGIAQNVSSRGESTPVFVVGTHEGGAYLSPIAMLSGHKLHKLEWEHDQMEDTSLEQGHQEFQRRYLVPGTRYRIFHDGAAAGTLTVTRTEQPGCDWEMASLGEFSRKPTTGFALSSRVSVASHPSWRRKATDRDIARFRIMAVTQLGKLDSSQIEINGVLRTQVSLHDSELVIGSAASKTANQIHRVFVIAERATMRPLVVHRHTAEDVEDGTDDEREMFFDQAV